MLDKTPIEKPWERMASWAVQIDVVEGLLNVLEEGRPNPFNRLVFVIRDKSALRGGEVKIVEHLRRFLARYSKKEKTALSKFAEDLRRQRKYLLSVQEPPPAARTTPEERQLIAERHTAHLAAERTSGEVER